MQAAWATDYPATAKANVRCTVCQLAADGM
jgi:DNA-binding SARP family transcriptional activator